MKRRKSLRRSRIVRETTDIAHCLHVTTAIGAGLDPGLLIEGKGQIMVVSTDPLLTADLLPGCRDYFCKPLCACLRTRIETCMHTVCE